MKITPNPEFDILLARGLAREEAFARVLLEDRVEPYRFEVKSEPRALEYGSVFIEYADHGIPTGLAISTADRHGFEVQHDRWIILPTPDLKRIAREVLLQRGPTFGGWEHRSEGVVLPLTRLLRP